MSSLVGLLVFYGVLCLGRRPDAPVEPRSGDARTALTSFLVFMGLLLIVFVEPPIRWFAVDEPLTDRSPAGLPRRSGSGIGLRRRAAQVPFARDFFQLIAPAPREALHRDPRGGRVGTPGPDLLGRTASWTGSWGGR